MKKTAVILLSVLMILCLYVSSSAYEYGYEGKTALVNDLADLLSDEDEFTLNNKLEQISESYECEISILTTATTDGTDLTAFADDYYDYNGFGYGEDCNGIMLVICMDIREYQFVTNGEAVYIFTDYNMSVLEDEIVPFMADDDYTSAFIAYYEKCVDIFDDYNTYVNEYGGEGIVTFPVDDEYREEENSPVGIRELFSVKWLAISLLIGIAVAFIYTTYLKSQLKTVKFKASASDYIVPGSFNLTGSRDVYLYNTIKKTPRPKENSSSRSGGSSFGSGSSTRSSSSGRTHGGSRGSF